MKTSRWLSKVLVIILLITTMPIGSLKVSAENITEGKTIKHIREAGRIDKPVVGSSNDDVSIKKPGPILVKPDPVKENPENNNVENKPKVFEVEKNSCEEGIIYFTGYALGLSEEIDFWGYEVFVDGENMYFWNLETESYRPDLKAKYPDYTNAENSGFEYKLDSTKLDNGQHKIKFKVGSIEKEITFNVENKPNIEQNESSNVQNKPKIFEVEGSTSEEGIIIIRGYALGFSRKLDFYFCDVFIDGTEVTGSNKATSLSGERYRPDLKAKYSEYTDAESSGFQCKLDSKMLKNGQHRIKFKFEGKEKEITFNVQNKPKVDVQNEPKVFEIEGSTCEKGILTVTGYGLGFNEKINFSNCKVYIDGIVQSGGYFNKIYRHDLKTKYPEYTYAEFRGFEYKKIDTTAIENGQHKIKFVFEGVEKETTIDIQNEPDNVHNKPRVFEVEKSACEKGIITFTGYALGFSKELDFMNFQVFVDEEEKNNTLTNLKTKIQRPDLKAKYPEYIDVENSGFEYKLDSTELKTGLHKIKFKFTSTEKEATFKEIAINVQNKPKVFEVEKSTCEKGVIIFTGYALGFSEELSFMNFDIFLDEERRLDTLSNMDFKINRPDLKIKYSDYVDAENSGFAYKLNTQNLKNGQHRINIDFEGMEKEIIFNIDNKKPVLEIESIKESKPGLLKIEGYKFSSFDEINDNFKVFIDEKLYDSSIFSMNKSIDSTDLLNNYPEYKNHNNSRFAYLVNTTRLTNGKHSVKFVWPEVEKSIDIYVNNLPNTQMKTDTDIMFLDEINAAIDEINSAMDGANNALDKMNAGIAEMNAAIGEMNKAMDGMNKALDKMNAEIDEMNRVLDKMNAGIAEMNNGVNSINLSINETIMVINNFNKSMDETIKAITEARYRIDNLLKTKAGSEASNNKALREQLYEYNKQLENLQKQKQNYNSKWYNQLWKYIKTSVGQVLMGKYTDNVTLLGTTGEIGIGFLGLDAPADLRDLCHDFEYWEYSWSHAGETTLDVIGFLPVVGIIKYGDEVGALIKNGEKYEVKKIIDIEKGLGKLNLERISYYLSKATNNPSSKKAILGLSGKYDDIGESMGYTYFKMTDDIWNDMVNETAKNFDEVWKVNSKFLDDQISAGKEILLSNDPGLKYLFDDGKPRFFQREIDYLIGKGYVFDKTSDGLWKATKK